MIETFLRSDQRNPLKVRDRNHRLIKAGGKVLLCNPHPHAGEVGTYLGVDKLAVGWGHAVRLEDGRECYVFEVSQWERVSK